MQIVLKHYHRISTALDSKIREFQNLTNGMERDKIEMEIGKKGRREREREREPNAAQNIRRSSRSNPSNGLLISAGPARREEKRREEKRREEKRRETGKRRKLHTCQQFHNSAGHKIGSE